MLERTEGTPDFRRKTTGGRIHSSRLAALADNIVARMMLDKHYAGKEGHRIACGHLVFAEDTGLQAFATVALARYYAIAFTALDKLREKAEKGGPKAVSYEIASWGLYPRTERAIMLSLFDLGDVAFQLPSIDRMERGFVPKVPRWATPLATHLVKSVKDNLSSYGVPAVEDGGEAQDIPKLAAYANARPTKPWDPFHWREAFHQIAVLSSPVTKNPDSVQETADAFNGEASLDKDGDIVVQTPPIYNVLIAGKIAYEGIDLQIRTCAIHHLDLPWEPATFTQRNGRAVRQNNVLGKVEIYSYLTDGTVDFYRLGRLEGRRAWLDSVLSPTPSAAPIGGTSEEEQKRMILYCTLRQNRAPVEKRLDEQIALLKQRKFAVLLGVHTRSFEALNTGGVLRSMVPLFMEPRPAMRYSQSQPTWLTLAKSPPYKTERATQDNSLVNLRDNGAIPKEDDPGYWGAGDEMRRAAQLRLTAHEGTVTGFEGGAGFITSPAVRSDADAKDVLNVACSESLYRMTRPDDDKIALWMGRRIEIAGDKGGERIGYPLVRKVGERYATFGWGIRDAAKTVKNLHANRKMLPDADGKPTVPTEVEITTGVDVRTPGLPLTADAGTVYVIDVLQNRPGDWKEVRGKGTGTIPHKPLLHYTLTMLGQKFMAPASAHPDKLPMLSLAVAPPQWLDANRTILRTFYTSLLWNVITRTGPDYDRFPEIGMINEERPEGQGGTYEVFGIGGKVKDGGARVRSGVYVVYRKGGEVGVRPRASGINSPLYQILDPVGGGETTLADVTGEPEAMAVSWRTERVYDPATRKHRDAPVFPTMTPAAIDASVAVGMAFFKLYALRRLPANGDVVPAIPRGEVDPLLAQILRKEWINDQSLKASEASMDAGEGSTHEERKTLAPMFEDGSIAQRILDGAHITREGVSWASISETDGSTAVFDSLDDFYDRMRNANIEQMKQPAQIPEDYPKGLHVEGFPAQWLLRPLLPGVWTDLRDFAALARDSRPGDGADSPGRLGLAYRVLGGYGTNFLTQALLEGSPRAAADQAAEKAAQEARAEQRAAQQQMWGQQPAEARKTITAERLADSAMKAKKQNRAFPLRISLKTPPSAVPTVGSYWFVPTIDTRVAGAVVVIEAKPVPTAYTEDRIASLSAAQLWADLKDVRPVTFSVAPDVVFAQATRGARTVAPDAAPSKGFKTWAAFARASGAPVAVRNDQGLWWWAKGGLSFDFASGDVQGSIQQIVGVTKEVNVDAFVKSWSFAELAAELQLQKTVKIQAATATLKMAGSRVIHGYRSAVGDKGK